MRETVNQRAEENILRAADIMAQADRYLEQQADRVWEEGGRQEPENRHAELENRCADPESRQNPEGSCSQIFAEIDGKLFLQQEEIIQTYLLRRMLDVTAPGWKDITSRHFAALAALARNQAGSRLDLPCGLAAEKTYETLRIFRKNTNEKNAEKGKRISLERRYITADGTLCLELEIPEERIQICTLSREKAGEIPKNQYTKWFDYDRIKGALSVRTRESGDYLMIAGGKRKLLKRFFIDEKIPEEKRASIPLLAEGSHVLWVMGYRISEFYKITENTRTILEVQVCKGEEDG